MDSVVVILTEGLGEIVPCALAPEILVVLPPHQEDRDAGVAAAEGVRQNPVRAALEVRSETVKAGQRRQVGEFLGTRARRERGPDA